MTFKKFKPFAAPKRFVFKDPDTGFNYEEKTEKELIQRIVNYRSQNQLKPIEHLELVLPNYWCGLPENLGECMACPPLNKLKRGLWPTIRGGIALVETLTYPKEHLVTQEEADNRAAICTKCVYNTFPDKGPFVRWSDKIAEAVLGDKRSKFHKLLGNCEVCTCTLKYKVFYKGDMGLNESQREKMRYVGCWQTEENGLEESQERKKALEINSRLGVRS